MDTKRVAMVAVFAALAIILDPDVSRISFPAPFLPFLPYQVWEIPIFTAFLLLGPKPGLFIALIGSAALLAFHPTFIAVGGIIACLAMLVGFFLAYKLVTRNVPPRSAPSTRKTVIVITAGAVIFRVGVMVIQNYFMLPPMLSLIGLDFSQSVILGVYIPLVALFNATEPLYVIPISYFLARAISSNLKIGNRL